MDGELMMLIAKFEKAHEKEDFGVVMVPTKSNDWKDVAAGSSDGTANAMEQGPLRMGGS